MSTIFMPPLAVQTICKLSGLMTVEAMAEPKNSANHTSTSLAMSFELRRVLHPPIMTKVKLIQVKLAKLLDVTGFDIPTADRFLG